MNQNNGNHHGVSVAEVVDSQTRADVRTPFHASDDAVLKPARETASGKGKIWKRSLMKWFLILLLIASGAVVLFLLTRVNRVPVKVQADAKTDTQRAKEREETGKSENNLTAEAINIAREASGNDAADPNKTRANASPNPSPTQSPAQFLKDGRSLAYTSNYSPVNEAVNNNAANGDANQQQTGNQNQTATRSADQLSTTSPQSHANATQSIFVEEAQPRLLATSLSNTTRSQLRTDKSVIKQPKVTPAVMPPFGTMLPVRTQGVIFTLRNNSYARMELTRDCAGSGWSLPKGTILVGRTAGGEYDRAFVSIVGYIDPHDNRLVKLSGEVLGADGAAGLPGKQVGVDRNRLKETLRKVASSGVQVAGTLAGALTGRGTVVIDGAGYRLTNPITDEARGLIDNRSGRQSFVKVQAGQAAYVMVADLPKSQPALDAPGEDDVAKAAHGLTEHEVMELILFGTPEDIRAATALMSDEQKQLVLKSLAPEEKR
jgi:hypothetical protein